MRIYEVLFIIRPDVPEEELDGIVEPLKSVVTAAGGAIDKVDKWGKRRLATGSEIPGTICAALSTKTRRNREGAAPAGERHGDQIHHVRIDQDLKRLEKLKKKREKRSQRKPSAPAPAPEAAAPANPMPAVPEPAIKK